MIMRSLMLTASLLTICGCNGYREVPLQDHVRDIQQIQLNTVTATKEAFNGTINEQSAIRLALSFNPEIRTPIIRDRGWGENEVQLRGIVRPELDVSTDEATINFTTDVLSLYNLLSPTERHAWREMRKAERKQAYADQKGAVIRLTRDVRLSFLELARLLKKSETLDKEVAYLSNYAAVKKLDKSDAIILSLAITESKQKIEKNDLEIKNAKITITRLLGIEPTENIKFDVSQTLSVTIMPEIKTIIEMSNSAKENNWQLVSLYSRYIRKEYELRQAYLRRWGSVSIGPSVTYTKEDDSVSTGISVRVRIPWPSHSDDRIADTIDDRSLEGARYTAALHDLQADITKQYMEMQAKWNSLKNPKVSVDWLETNVADEMNNFTVHEYINVISKVLNQELFQIDEVSKYKMSGIILDSLLK